MKLITEAIIVCIALGLLLMPGVQATGQYTLVKTWGSLGHGDGQFEWPWGVTVDSSGNVYVADAHNNRVQKFDSNGIFLAKWGSFGQGDGQFDGSGNNGPYGVVSDANGNIYMTDCGPRSTLGNNRIQKFTSDGTFVTKWGSYGSGDGQFASPIGIGMDSLGYVYVADWYNFRIQKFTPDGIFITKWGTEGSGDGQFEYPQSVAGDAAGNIFVADTYNHRIQKFDSNGNFLMKWGSYGNGDGQFYLPAGVVVDSSGNVYISDSWNQRVQKFTADGKFLTKWSVPSQWAYLQGITVDGEGNVYVVNNGYNRVQKFAQENEIPEFPSMVVPVAVIVGCMIIVFSLAKRE
jgi:sugar lactone lactonase YvrE